MIPRESDARIEWEGRHLRVVVRNGWEYVSRTASTGVVGIVAVTDDGKLILVEQHRVPVIPMTGRTGPRVLRKATPGNAEL